MTELETLRAVRAGQIDRQTAHERFTAAGWDESDVGLLLENTGYTRGEPIGADFAQQFIDRQEAQRRGQTNALTRR
jgi:hypothetical protein